MNPRPGTWTKQPSPMTSSDRTFTTVRPPPHSQVLGRSSALSWAYWHARLDNGACPAASDAGVPALSTRRRRSTLPTWNAGSNARKACGVGHTGLGRLAHPLVLSLRRHS